MSKISAIIITKNEEKHISACIHSLRNLVDEIIVIDAFSTDKTKNIAIEQGAKVVQKAWEGYSQNKNYGNTLAQNEWILSIDADEVISAELAQSIQQLELQKNTIYSFNRLNNYCGKWIRHSNWHPDWNIRLFHRQLAKWEGDFVHEKLNFPKTIKIQRLTGLLYHYSYTDDADHWQRIEKYAQLSAQQLLKDGKKANFIKLWLSPIARFIKTFFLKKGILDGKAGWTISWRNAYLVHRKYQILKNIKRR
jgi:glycosyltransferase involved in cell wall biosynthesis